MTNNNNDRIEALARRILSMPRPTTPIVDDDIADRLFRSVFAVSSSLSVPRESLAHLFMLAYDRVSPTDFPSDDALVFAYISMIFALYRFNDDAFDTAMMRHLP